VDQRGISKSRIGIMHREELEGMRQEIRVVRAVMKYGTSATDYKTTS
jgi:hypothetical protein